jgi:perosamine synthetase
MAPAHVKDSITDKTKAIIPVHLFGNPCSMDEILSIAQQHNLYVIEDATESLGTKYKGKFTGAFGDFGVFSFNGNKLITTGGGGMILGPDERRLQHIKVLVNQAKDERRPYYHPEVGFNYSMSNIQAAIGLAQLIRLNGFIEKKKHFYEIYSQAFEHIVELQLQKAYPDSQAIWWLSSLVIDTDKIGQSIPEIQQNLKDKGVPTRRVFMPLVESPPYSEHDKGRYPNAYRIYETGLNLPSSTLNSYDDIQFVTETLIRALTET